MASTKAAASAGEQDAIALLKSDHKKVKTLFSEFEKLKDDGAAKTPWAAAGDSSATNASSKPLIVV